MINLLKKLTATQVKHGSTHSYYTNISKLACFCFEIKTDSVIITTSRVVNCVVLIAALSDSGLIIFFFAFT
jgi:hypothetical protein